MAETAENSMYSPDTELEDSRQDPCTPEEASEALKLVEGRWKMFIVFRLFEKPAMRFSELERRIPGVTQKMLIQQLRELERDSIVGRTIYPVIPPKVEYFLTPTGRALYPALDALLKWAKIRKAYLEEQGNGADE